MCQEPWGCAQSKGFSREPCLGPELLQVHPGCWGDPAGWGGCGTQTSLSDLVCMFLLMQKHPSLSLHPPPILPESRTTRPSWTPRTPWTIWQGRHRCECHAAEGRLSWGRVSEGWSRAERAEQRRASCSSHPQPLGHPAQVDALREPAHLRETLFCKGQNSQQACWAASLPLQGQSPVLRELRTILVHAQGVTALPAELRVSLSLWRKEGEQNMEGCVHRYNVHQCYCTFCSSERGLYEISEQLYFWRAWRNS